MKSTAKKFTAQIADHTSYDQSEPGFAGFVALEYNRSPDLVFLGVYGQILVPNPGVEVQLVYAHPQGTNPGILLLNVLLLQWEGVWPEVQTWKSAYYLGVGTAPGAITDIQLNAPFGSETVKVIQLN